MIFIGDLMGFRLFFFLNPTFVGFCSPFIPVATAAINPTKLGVITNLDVPFGGPASWFLGTLVNWFE